MAFEEDILWLLDQTDVTRVPGNHLPTRDADPVAPSLSVVVQDSVDDRLRHSLTERRGPNQPKILGIAEVAHFDEHLRRHLVVAQDSRYIGTPLPYDAVADRLVGVHGKRLAAERADDMLGEIASKLHARLDGIADGVSLTHNRAPDPSHWADIVRELGGETRV